MSSRYKEFYKDRIFGDDTTPPHPSTSKPPVSTKTDSTTTTDSSPYPFTRTALSSTRLNLQHQLWTLSTTHLLHPSIPISPNLKISDIACGTGIWSLSLSLPSTHKIEAHDLSLTLTPPQEWTPQNISFHQTDMFAPVPENLKGRYDIVHARLLLCTFDSGDPMPLLKNLMEMVKPGGFLQWQEFNPANERILTSQGSSTPALEAFRAAFAGHVAQHAWIGGMHERFGEVGGELVAHEKCWTSPQARTLKQEVTFLAVREWCGKLRGEGKVELAGKYERLMEEAERECWAMGRGAVIDTEMVTWVVRKL